MKKCDYHLVDLSGKGLPKATVEVKFLETGTVKRYCTECWGRLGR